MKRKIFGSRALVTGASSGIGREIALALARQGADLLVTARREAELESLAGEIRALGRRCEALPGDVADEATRQALLDRMKTTLGGLDILVNNAGISAIGRFADAGPERLRRIMEVNFFAAAELTRAAVPLLREGRRPIVVNIGSILGHVSIPRCSEYCTSKFALRGWTDAVRAELATLGIDVLLVSPGSTETPFFDHVIDKQGELPWKRTRRTPPSAVAAATVRAIARGKHEIIPSTSGRLLVWINRKAPALVRRVVARYG